jgi:hypothetical protein
VLLGDDDVAVSGSGAECGHVVAVTQVRGVGPGKAYVDKLLAAGKTRTEAIRLLRRRLSDVVFRALLADERAEAKHADSLAEDHHPHAA